MTGNSRRDSGVRVVEAVHGLRQTVPDPQFELDLAAHLRARHPNRTNFEVRADGRNITGVEIALWTYPDPVTYNPLAVETAAYGSPTPESTEFSAAVCSTSGIPFRPLRSSYPLVTGDVD